MEVLLLELRRPCDCGHTQGEIRTNNGQDTLWCIQCGKYQYNAPKTETGRSPRTVKTVHDAISGKARLFVLELRHGKM